MVWAGCNEMHVINLHYLRALQCQGIGCCQQGSAVITTTSYSDNEDGGGHKKDSKKPDNCLYTGD